VNAQIPTVRRLWHLFEPVHALVYFAPEKKARYEACGLKGGWMGYFASRSAAMGAVSPGVVTATFYNFAPRMVRRALPDAWSLSTPARVLEARGDVVDTALRRILGDNVDSPEVAFAAELLGRAAATCSPEGRPLYAAHAELEWPEEPHMQLWHAATLLREFRGDGHVAALTTHEIDGCEANVLITADGLTARSEQRLYRGWTEEEWSTTGAGLRERGLLDRDSSLTDEGRALRTRVEKLTDDLAAPMLEGLDDEDIAELERALNAILILLDDAAAIEFPNPIGLPRFRPSETSGTT
jgi:hypothetical protein